jgi:hypothetical protein
MTRLLSFLELRNTSNSWTASISALQMDVATSDMSIASLSTLLMVYISNRFATSSTVSVIVSIPLPIAIKSSRSIGVIKAAFSSWTRLWSRLSASCSVL